MWKQETLTSNETVLSLSLSLSLSFSRKRYWGHTPEAHGVAHSGGAGRGTLRRRTAWDTSGGAKSSP